jgi:D-glycero-beta-D-manno-heptose 1-phosphate adenylyltransferase
MAIYRNMNISPEEKVILDYLELIRQVEAYRVQRAKIVTTIGSWDMLHVGHGRYLRQARTYGDLLVVGVDSDEAIRRYKGPYRPMIPQEERLEMLSYLEFVDLITVIEDVDKEGVWYYSLLKMLRPDVYVAVEDSYPEHQQQVIRLFCGQLIVLPRQAENTSSTQIIQKMIKADPEQMRIITQGVKEEKK